MEVFIVMQPLAHQVNDGGIQKAVRIRTMITDFVFACHYKGDSFEDEANRTML